MPERLDRRGFLRIAGLASASLAFRPYLPPAREQPVGLGRVAAQWIGRYAEPSFRSKTLGRLSRDHVLTLYERVMADEGPAHNPFWYRLSDGYAHSGNLQPVRWEPQTPLDEIPEGGALFEVSVPWTRARREADPDSDPLYRLYFQATAWAEQSVVGADGRRWYGLLDDLLRVRYYARAEHLRWVPPSEISPLSPDVPLGQKRIEVHLARQELLAFERSELVLRTRISSGIPDPRPRENGIPTATPTGAFHIDKKMPLRHMGDGRLTASLEAYELPGVPWVSFFHSWGIAFHGTYWHDDYGRPRSRGCVNMRPEEAKWLYRWTLPAVPADSLLKIGLGTPVRVM